MQAQELIDEARCPGNLFEVTPLFLLGHLADVAIFAANPARSWKKAWHEPAV